MMNALKKTINVPLGLIALAAILVLTYQAGAMLAAQPAPKAVTVATVDLEKVLANLNERAEADTRLMARGQSLDAENTRRLAQIEQMGKDLEELYVPGEVEHQKAEEAFQQEALAYRVWREFEMAKIEREKGLIFERLYTNVKKAVADTAQGRYDIVLLNDSVKELQRGNEQVVGQQVSARRILYANPQLDITQQIIDRMNNEFNARGNVR